LAPRDVPPPPKPQPNSPQYVPQGEDSFEIVVTVPAGEDDEDNTPFCNAEKDEMFHDADEIKTVGNEAPIPTGGLRDLLNHLNITTHLEFRIKMMKTKLPLATPRRMRCSTTPMRSRPPEMKPRSPPAG
jgi:hypothetical protein